MKKKKNKKNEAMTEYLREREKKRVNDLSTIQTKIECHVLTMITLSQEWFSHTTIELYCEQGKINARLLSRWSSAAKYLAI